MKQRDYYTLAPDQNKRIFEEKITPQLYGGLITADNPTASFIRAQPGAGKSIVQKHIADKLQEEQPEYARLQQQDEAVAAFYTDLDSGAWTERAIDLSKDVRSHVTLEGTLRNEAPTLQTAREYAEYDMMSELYMVAVNELISRSRIFQRYIDQLHATGSGRYTLLEAHDAAYSVLHDTTHRTVDSKLFQKVHIMGSNGEVVDSFDGMRATAADEVTSVFERTRRLTPAQLDAVGAQLADLEEAIADQPNDSIRRDFNDLRVQVRQQSRVAVGGLALRASIL
jgi:hypothetical protein